MATATKCRKSTTSIPVIIESMKLLITDDDHLFAQTLARQLTRRGHQCTLTHTSEEALAAVENQVFDAAITDLVMPGESGLILVEQLHYSDPELPILVLTGYASIATAVEAIKLGARHYLAKPAIIDEILLALEQSQGNAQLNVQAKPLSVDRLEWEHIQKVLQEHEGNVSATARALNMHRRTLQRKLDKFAPQ
jgi:two-component system response regulator RegA